MRKRKKRNNAKATSQGNYFFSSIPARSRPLFFLVYFFPRLFALTHCKPIYFFFAFALSLSLSLSPALGAKGGFLFDSKESVAGSKAQKKRRKCFLSDVRRRSTHFSRASCEILWIFFAESYSTQVGGTAIQLGIIF